MGKQIAKSQGNHGRRAGQRNQGLPGGVKRGKAGHNVLASAEQILAKAPTLYELGRRTKVLNRWGVAFGKSETSRQAS